MSNPSCWKKYLCECDENLRAGVAAVLIFTCVAVLSIVAWVPDGLFAQGMGPDSINLEYGHKTPDFTDAGVLADVQNMQYAGFGALGVGVIGAGVGSTAWGRCDDNNKTWKFCIFFGLIVMVLGMFLFTYWDLINTAVEIEGIEQPTNVFNCILDGQHLGGDEFNQVNYLAAKAEFVVVMNDTVDADLTQMLNAPQMEVDGRIPAEEAAKLGLEETDGLWTGEFNFGDTTAQDVQVKGINPDTKADGLYTTESCFEFIDGESDLAELKIPEDIQAELKAHFADQPDLVENPEESAVSYSASQIEIAFDGEPPDGAITSEQVSDLLSHPEGTHQLVTMDENGNAKVMKINFEGAKEVTINGQTIPLGHEVTFTQVEGGGGEWTVEFQDAEGNTQTDEIQPDDTQTDDTQIDDTQTDDTQIDDTQTDDTPPDETPLGKGKITYIAAETFGKGEDAVHIPGRWLFQQIDGDGLVAFIKPFSEVSVAEAAAGRRLIQMDSSNLVLPGILLLGLIILGWLCYAFYKRYHFFRKKLLKIQPLEEIIIHTLRSHRCTTVRSYAKLCHE